jgi:bifunctional DNA-binding transcriptional regulator/antitoxin component of YhaV-PrlF toxin-antitoxin module
MRWTLPVEADSDGELLLTFPDELMEDLDWKVGDTIQWIMNDDGSCTLKKKDENSNIK